MLLSTATEAETRITVVHDSFVRTGHLTASVGFMVTGVIVKRAKHSVLCGLASFFFHTAISRKVVGKKCARDNPER